MKKIIAFIFAVLIAIDIHLFYVGINKQNEGKVQRPHSETKAENNIQKDRAYKKRTENTYKQSKPPGKPPDRTAENAASPEQWGGYMKRLESKIKNNWKPIRHRTSKRIVAIFKIAKDGTLISARITKSSGNIAADKIALKAIKLSAPFEPLPEFFDGKSIEIEFTFDYNVLSK